MVTPAVWHDAFAPGRSAAHAAGAPWLSVRTPRDARRVEHVLQTYRLHSGEAESIVLASELGTLLIIDERRGRKAAQALGVRMTGLFGVLAAAKTAGLLASVRPLLDQIGGTSFRASDALIRRFLDAVGEGD